MSESKIDIEKIAAEAASELSDELNADAKRKIKAKLRQISQAKNVLVNLEAEYATLLEELRESII
jgi:hypothetical protein